MIYSEPPQGFTPKFEVTSCFINCHGKLLLLHRCDHKPQGNTWGVPAGKIHEGENEIDALLREVGEEVDLSLTPDQLNSNGKVYVVYPTYQFVYHMFTVNFSDFPVLKINPDEHKDHRWVTPEEALRMDLIQDEDACIKLIYGI